MKPFQRSRLSLVLMLVAVLGLAYDAKVHLGLADDYDPIGGTITQGVLFRVEAVVAIVIAVALLVWDHRLVWVAAGMTGLAGVTAVLLYRYVDVGAIGPIPNMYEPVWFAEKTRSALAEGGVVLAWLAREGVRASGVPDELDRTVVIT
ncbi:MAG: hypothetical protein JJD92_15875 [Frankiaceae bacterium]|nr:hypothetical protein [Frankiaceae bacterium]